MDVLRVGPIPSSERGDLVRPGRLQGFSDAVFATAATLLVIPIRKLELEGDETLKAALLKRVPQLIVFVVGFLVICAVWESHCLRFRIVSKADDFIVFLTLFSLMFTTFLPFTVALEGKFGSYPIAVVLPSLMLFVLEAIELITLLYSFRAERLLTSAIRNLRPDEIRMKKRQVVGKCVFNCALFILAAAFSPLNVIISWILLITVIFSSFVRKMLGFVYRKWCSAAIEDESRVDVWSGNIDKERIECFSDAAVAIVATLLVLDITTENFPKEVDVKKDGLPHVLRDMWQLFVAYIGSYVTIALLWFVHHSVLHHIRLLTPSMMLANNTFLAFLAGTPFVSTLVNKFTGKSSHNEKIAVRVSCVIIFMAGLMHIILLVLALLQKEKLMYAWASPEDRGTHTHRYLFLKTLVIPICTLITFFCSLSTEYVTYIVYHVALFVVPILFLVLKLIFACHCCQNSHQRANSDLDDSESFSVEQSSIGDIFIYPEENK